MRWISLDFAPSPKATVDANGFFQSAGDHGARRQRAILLAYRRRYAEGVSAADEVAKSVSSVEQLPITVGHPARLLTPDDAKRHAVGSLANMRLEGDRVMADAASSTRRPSRWCRTAGPLCRAARHDAAAAAGRSPNGDAFDAVQTDIAAITSQSSIAHVHPERNCIWTKATPSPPTSMKGRKQS